MAGAHQITAEISMHRIRSRNASFGLLPFTAATTACGRLLCDASMCTGSSMLAPADDGYGAQAGDLRRPWGLGRTETAPLAPARWEEKEAARQRAAVRRPGRPSPLAAGSGSRHRSQPSPAATTEFRSSRPRPQPRSQQTPAPSEAPPSLYRRASAPSRHPSAPQLPDRRIRTTRCSTARPSVLAAPHPGSSLVLSSGSPDIHSSHWVLPPQDVRRRPSG